MLQQPYSHPPSRVDAWRVARRLELSSEGAAASREVRDVVRLGAGRRASALNAAPRVHSLPTRSTCPISVLARQARATKIYLELSSEGTAASREVRDVGAVARPMGAFGRSELWYVLRTTLDAYSILKGLYKTTSQRHSSRPIDSRGARPALGR